MSGTETFAPTDIKSTRQKCPLASSALWIYVIDKRSKEKIAGARIAVTGPGNRQGQLPKSGPCQVINLPAGTYDVTASATAIRGYENSTANSVQVTLGSGDIGTVTIEVEVDEKIVVQLVDHAGLPVAGEAISLTMPYGVSVQGKLTTAGWQRASKIRQAGACKISLPQLDDDVWEFVGTTPGTDPPAAAGPAATPAAVTSSSAYQVVAGDCLHSIAYRAGLPVSRIWDAPGNARLKQTRKDPAVLLPGDIVQIPAKRTDKVASKATGSTHKFRRTDTLKDYRLQVLTGETPLKNIPCTVKVDGNEVDVKKNGDWITFRIRPDAKEAVVTLGFIHGKVGMKQLATELEYRIRLGCLRPVDTPEGQEDRLRDLGYYDAWPSGRTPELKDVIQLFQASHGISPADGDPAASTLAKLIELTGDPA